ncbi:hypothetical protein BRETT_004347 [Brettanomyces bruxellensis]|uniref:RING-type E3 ubiquitin transferase n=1 Tax=Dekkera bruxellensis TaxID=5007 RepID=A0A871R1W4_DEKBR|nr:uncharacterized protein BRETT_004347 [Brettanomyces bruxellensis]QOU19126.1 hypothetical protein BRETT_004347 [Brettanomyces bruxellensis]
MSEVMTQQVSTETGSSSIHSNISNAGFAYSPLYSSSHSSPHSSPHSSSHSSSHSSHSSPHSSANSSANSSPHSMAVSHPNTVPPSLNESGTTSLQIMWQNMLCFMCIKFHECAEELDMIRHALREGSSSILNDSSGNSLLSRENKSAAALPNMLIKTTPEHVTTTEMSKSSSQVTLTNDAQTGQGSSNGPIHKPYSGSQTRANHKIIHEDPTCPVCGKFLGFLNEAQRENHTSQCLESQDFSCSPQSRRTYNRMLVSTIPKDANVDKLQLNEDNECIICMEEFKPGDKIGRLECLCCFHYKCIRDWFKHKGRCECPVHILHYDS